MVDKGHFVSYTFGMDNKDDYDVLERLVAATDKIRKYAECLVAINMIVAKNLGFRDSVRQAIEAEIAKLLE